MSVVRSLILLLLLAAAIVVAQEFGNLWCQQGEKKSYSPAQCTAQTIECFKFVCDGIDGTSEGFVARGCGVSVLTTANGLPNQSCHQAQSICEYLGGESHCHLCGDKHFCNGSTSLATFPIAFLFSMIVFFLFPAMLFNN